MRKLYVLLMMTLLGTATTWARPGYSKPVDVIQPDGTTVTLLMRGDEFLSFMTTTDGYTVIKGDDGFYRYAELYEGGLKATDVVAKNPDVRLSGEWSFLARQKKNIHPEMSEEMKQVKADASQMYSANYQHAADGQRRSVTIWNHINYNNFKGLVVLVNFSDRKFTIDNPQAFYQRLTNEQGLQDTSHSHYPVDITGSARDYFYANSMGIFNPTFDVVGPVEIDKTCDYPCPKDENGQMDYGFYNRFNIIAKDALGKVNADVDFSNYDLNSDGVIDMVYFIFAGYGSYVQGNSYKYIWPHAGDLKNYSKQTNWRYDGKYIGRYACSVEIQDYEALASQHVWLDGIGTICHEFSHVLGLADHYDTDYEENGQAEDPGVWDIMAAGADHNYGLTPVGYNVFERHILGFTEPQVLEVAGNYELEPFNTGNKGYIIKTGTTDDDFYIENRQKQGWDAFLPGHGLLVWRAETSNASVWKGNSVNIDPNHLYFQLLKAQPNKGMATGYVPFPGQGNVIDITSDTEPALRSWSGKEAKMDLYDITETPEGNITFKAGKNVYPLLTENFEQAALTTADATDVKGVFCNWNLTKATIAQVTDELGNGSHVVKMERSSTLTSSPLTNAVRSMSFKVWNGSQKVRISLKYSTDGSKWTIIKNSNGDSQAEVSKDAVITLSFNQAIPAGAQLQINMLATNTSAVAYVDDIKVSFDQISAEGIQPVEVGQSHTTATYNLSGQRVSDGYKGLIIRNGKKQVRY